MSANDPKQTSTLVYSMPRLKGAATAKPIYWTGSRLIHPGAVPSKVCCGNSADGLLVKTCMRR